MFKTNFLNKKGASKGKDKSKNHQLDLSLNSLQIAKRYCITSLLFFALQSIIALGGGLEQIFPDFPSPVSFQNGRAIHLNLSLYWPTFGLMGITYYFFIKELEIELYSLRLAKLQFWVFFLTEIGILGSLAVGLNDGREYLEAKLPFRILILVTLIIFAYNLLRSYFKPQATKGPTTFIMLTGVISSVVLFTPNLVFFYHPTLDDFVRFWVVHMWEEMSFELVGAGVTVAILLSITNVKRKTLEKILFLDATLILLTGTLATGHHYYWIGTSKLWVWIGGLFSALQVVPTVIVFYTIFTHLRVKGRIINNLVVLGFLIASAFYHLTGAGLLGLLMSIPSLNLYMHGTLITSSHSHLAVFGVFGFMVLGCSYYILTRELSFDKTSRLKILISFLLINFGLLIMGLALFVGGLLQTYLWRVAGVDFMAVQILLKPYHFIRELGGLIFTSGALMFCWSIIQLLRKNKAKLF